MAVSSIRTPPNRFINDTRVFKFEKEKKMENISPDALIDQMEKKMKISKKKGGVPPVVKQIAKPEKGDLIRARKERNKNNSRLKFEKACKNDIGVGRGCKINREHFIYTLSRSSTTYGERQKKTYGFMITGMERQKDGF